MKNNEQKMKQHTILGQKEIKHINGAGICEYYNENLKPKFFFLTYENNYDCIDACCNICKQYAYSFEQFPQNLMDAIPKALIITCADQGEKENESFN